MSQESELDSPWADRVIARFRSEKLVSPWVVNALLILAGIVWLGNFAAAVLVRDYRINEAINAIMLAVIGGIFSVRNKDKKNSGEGK